MKKENCSAFDYLEEAANISDYKNEIHDIQNDLHNLQNGNDDNLYDANDIASDIRFIAENIVSDFTQIGESVDKKEKQVLELLSKANNDILPGNMVDYTSNEFYQEVGNQEYSL